MMSTMQQRLPKSRRVPEAVAGKRVTERGIEIIKTIARYRFLLARDIVRLVGGNEDVTHRHLQQLYHQDLIGRFTLPEPTHRGEFIYFLDNASGLRQLAEASKLDAENIPWDEIRQNREKYSQKESHSVGRFLFIQHELMISALHADLETAGKNDPSTELERWVQGPTLWGSVLDKQRKPLPHRPDAFFTLRFPNAPEGQQRSNFFYEADRNTCNLTRIRQKLEAHLLFFMQGKHTERYGIRKVRAVLIQTISNQRAEQMRAVARALADAMPLANHLFWFTESDEQPAYARRWRTGGDDRVKSLRD
jgi:hypothetical protein